MRKRSEHWIAAVTAVVWVTGVLPAAAQESIQEREEELDRQFQEAQERREVRARLRSVRARAAAAAPTLGDADLALDGDISLGQDTDIFKGGDLWISSSGGGDSFGEGALGSNTTGFTNVAIGASALEANTTGYLNTAVGNSAMKSNLDGNRNTAVGLRALYGATSGFGNTAIGDRALSSTTTANYSTAVGIGALRNHAGAGSNTAIGAGSLEYGVDAGAQNTGVGLVTLRYNEGSQNTAVGNAALYYNDTGDANSAIGASALLGNTTGGSNTGLGRTTLASNTTGSFNHAIGRSVLFNLDGGSYNIAIGHLSDPSPPYWACAGCNLTAGDHNILLANAGVNGDAGTIRIGNSTDHSKAFMAGIHNTGITGVHAVYVDANGQLGMDTSSARFKRNIQDMGGASRALLDLRPVTFERIETEDGSTQYGLIAEEVTEVRPELVLLDDQGRPLAVKYHLLAPMLLNEVQRQEEELAELRAVVVDLRRRLAVVAPEEVPRE